MDDFIEGRHGPEDRSLGGGRYRTRGDAGGREGAEGGGGCLRPFLRTHPLPLWWAALPRRRGGVARQRVRGVQSRGCDSPRGRRDPGGPPPERRPRGGGRDL